MKIFLCWSGERSRQFADAASQFLQAMFKETVTTQISSNIEKGAVWFEELSDALRQARVGLICFTPEAVGSPWIHFEAGILAKALHDRSEAASADVVAAPGTVVTPPGAGTPPRRSTSLRIFPFLYGVDGAALKGPLTAYQSTLANDRDDVWRLVEAIQTIVDEAAEGPPSTDGGRAVNRRMRDRFEAAWPVLTAQLKAIKPARLSVVLPDFESLFQRKTFDESMYDCLDQSWIARYDGARSVEARLRPLQKTVREACARYVADMFDAVIADVTAYAMCLAVQLAEPRAPIDPSGRVDFPHAGVATACERLRKRIKELVARVVDDAQAPMFQEAFQFERVETSFEKKRAILRRAAEIRQPKTRTAFIEEMNAPVARDGLESVPKRLRCRDSDWDFDRIVYYMWVEEIWTDMPLATHLRCVRTELEREMAGANDPFRLPLAYALRVIAKGLRGVSDVALRSEAGTLLGRIAATLPAAATDGLGDLRQAVSDVRAVLEAAASAAPAPMA